MAEGFVAREEPAESPTQDQIKALEKRLTPDPEDPAHPDPANYHFGKYVIPKSKAPASPDTALKEWQASQRKLGYSAKHLEVLDQVRDGFVPKLDGGDAFERNHPPGSPGAEISVEKMRADTVEFFKGATVDANGDYHIGNIRIPAKDFDLVHSQALSSTDTHMLENLQAVAAGGKKIVIESAEPGKGKELNQIARDETVKQNETGKILAACPDKYYGNLAREAEIRDDRDHIWVHRGAEGKGAVQNGKFEGAVVSPPEIKDGFMTVVLENPRTHKPEAISVREPVGVDGKPLRNQKGEVVHSQLYDAIEGVKKGDRLVVDVSPSGDRAVVDRPPLHQDTHEATLRQNLGAQRPDQPPPSSRAVQPVGHGGHAER